MCAGRGGRGAWSRVSGEDKRMRQGMAIRAASAASLPLFRRTPSCFCIKQAPNERRAEHFPRRPPGTRSLVCLLSLNESPDPGWNQVPDERPGSSCGT
jgi:hypothetical protein